MDEKELTDTIIEDLFEYVMTHDVNPDHIEDYLDDIMDMMKVEEELEGGINNKASRPFMARQLF